MDPLARIIDANANRAREALRVLEDGARFALDDATLSARLKSLRHGLREALGALPLDDAQRLASRDTPGDVGVRISTEAEGRRTDLADIVAAAAMRLTEALRSIEEASKAVAPGAGARFEAMRYEAYDVERSLRLALVGARAAQWRVCVLITESLCRRPWEDVARASIDAGADCLQLREKTLDGAEMVRRAARLVELARASARRPAVIVNDRPDVALLSGADGVHVGQTDLTVAQVRQIAGRRLLVGVSTHELDQAREARLDGADYCGVGPMFATSTKTIADLAGPAYLRAYLSADPPLPAHLAIGGVTPENVRALIDAGARGVAVSSCVCGASDPGAVVAALRDALDASVRRGSAAGAG